MRDRRSTTDSLKESKDNGAGDWGLPTELDSFDSALSFSRPRLASSFSSSESSTKGQLIELSWAEGLGQRRLQLVRREAAAEEIIRFQVLTHLCGFQFLELRELVTLEKCSLLVQRENRGRRRKIYSS